MVFGIQSTNIEVKNYLLGLKIKSEELTFNPFKIVIKQINKDFFVLDFTPIFPKIFLLGLLMIPFIFLFRGISSWLIIPLFIIFTGVFWLDRYYYCMIWLGLKKKKVSTQDLVYFNCQEVSRRLI